MPGALRMLRGLVANWVFKPAGGMLTVNDAVIYYTIVKEILGEEWLDNQWFRLGTSRLANLFTFEIKGEEMKFF